MNRKGFRSHWINILGGVRNFTVASQPCSSGHITADKGENASVKPIKMILISSS